MRKKEILKLLCFIVILTVSCTSQTVGSSANTTNTTIKVEDTKPVPIEKVEDTKPALVEQPESVKVTEPKPFIVPKPTMVLTQAIMTKYSSPFKTIDIKDLIFRGNLDKPTPEDYLKVLQQFDLPNNPRYALREIPPSNVKGYSKPYIVSFFKDNLGKPQDITPSPSKKPGEKSYYTYCNIYAWDATRAMGAEIPHYYKYKGKTYELNANSTALYLSNKIDPKWVNVTREEAISNANKGLPTVVSGFRSVGIGHIAMIAPNVNGDMENMYLVQAGSQNSNYIKFEDVFKDGKRHVIRYYTYKK